MSPIESVTTVFKKYVDFSGRARRSEFWWFMLIVTIISIILDNVFAPELAADASLWDQLSASNPAADLWSLATLLPSLAVTFRRLHDIDKSGWNFLWAFTIVGIPVVIYWYAKDSQAGENSHGPNPKGV